MAKLKILCEKALQSGESPEHLARSLAMGVYIAFSPFPGGHTIMILAARFFFGFNLPLLFVGATLNNPWTMVPFYTLDYTFGYWFVHYFLGFTDTWTISLERVFGGGSICFASFLIGGNMLGLIGGVASYPLARRLCERYASRGTS